MKQFMEFQTAFPPVFKLSNQELWRIHLIPISDNIQNTSEYLSFRQRIEGELDRRFKAKTMKLVALISAKPSC